MRHGKKNIKFGRHSAHRKATLASLVSALIIYNRIETTLAKAKEARRLADRLITWAKKGTIHARRLAYSVLRDRKLVGMLFKDLGPLFAKRNGGYTRVMHTRIRPGDGAQLAILEWTEKKQAEVVEKKKAKKEAKPEVKKEQPKPEVHEEKPKDHLKHEVKRPEAPKQTEGHKQKKGFLGGLRKLFGDNRRGQK